MDILIVYLLDNQFSFGTYAVLVSDLKYLLSEFDVDYMLLDHYICITLLFYVIYGLPLDLELEFKYVIT